MSKNDTLTRFSRGMDGFMEPDENGSWVRFEAARAALSATQPAPDDGWLRDRGLLYRLTDDRHPHNRDEIRVMMADGSRSDESCSRRAGELLDRIRATLPAQDEQGEQTDGMGVPTSCGKPLCSPGDHHPLCKITGQQAGEVVALGDLAKRNVFDAIREAYDLGYNDARNARAVPGGSAPGYAGRDVESDHGGALFNTLNRRLATAPPAPAQPVQGAPDEWRSALTQCVQALEFAHHKSGVVQGMPCVSEAIVSGTAMLADPATPPAQQAAQSEPVKPLFASKIAARKWAELQDDGARMQSIAFDGHKCGQPGTIDPWGVVRWGQAAQGAGEVVAPNLVPAGFLLHWPSMGGGRKVIWHESRSAGDAIGCPVEAVFKLAAGGTQPAAGADVLDAQRWRAVENGSDYLTLHLHNTRSDGRAAVVDAAIAASGRQS